jgi:hypothetical protein
MNVIILKNYENIYLSVFYDFSKFDGLKNQDVMVPSGMTQGNSYLGPLTNRHLLILDGHGSHVTFEAIGQAKKFGLNMITLVSHTSHAF